LFHRFGVAQADGRLHPDGKGSPFSNNDVIDKTIEITPAVFLAD
jgi:hypothetical protein